MIITVSSPIRTHSSVRIWVNAKKWSLFLSEMNSLAQLWHYSRKIKELNQFTSAIESKVTGRSWRGNHWAEPVEAKRSREAKQKESSCLFDGAIKGLFMFISHLKRSHKTSDCTHKPSVGHKSCRETECVWVSPRFWYVRSKKSNSLHHDIEQRLRLA